MLGRRRSAACAVRVGALGVFHFATQASCVNGNTVQVHSAPVDAPAFAPDAPYTRVEAYQGHDFFTKWNFWTKPDPTKGYVDYVDEAVARQRGLIQSSPDNVVMAADATHQTGDGGRPSIRIESKTQYNRGLFIADIAHIPTGCGTWPAFWMYGEDSQHIWPRWGEYDIIEGTHQDSVSSTTLHTTDKCNQKGVDSGGDFDSTWNLGAQPGASADNCFVDAQDQWHNQGCSQKAPQDSMGAGFNLQGGGVYAAEWDPVAKHIRTWYWPAGSEPADVKAKRPEPHRWGTPFSFFSLRNKVCAPQHFKNMRLVFDLTFCGDLGNAVWNLRCPGLKMTCDEFVAKHPQNMTEAYWSVRSLDVYDRTGSASPATVPPATVPPPPSTSTVLPTASPSSRVGTTTALRQSPWASQPASAQAPVQKPTQAPQQAPQQTPQQPPPNSHPARPQQPREDRRPEGSPAEVPPESPEHVWHFWTRGSDSTTTTRPPAPSQTQPGPQVGERPTRGPVEIRAAALQAHAWHWIDQVSGLMVAVLAVGGLAAYVRRRHLQDASQAAILMSWVCESGNCRHMTDADSDASSMADGSPPGSPMSSPAVPGRDLAMSRSQDRAEPMLGGRGIYGSPAALTQDSALSAAPPMATAGSNCGSGAARQCERDSADAYTRLGPPQMSSLSRSPSQAGAQALQADAFRDAAGSASLPPPNAAQPYGSPYGSPSGSQSVGGRRGAVLWQPTGGSPGSARHLQLQPHRAAGSANGLQPPSLRQPDALADRAMPAPALAHGGLSRHGQGLGHDGQLGGSFSASSTARSHPTPALVSSKSLPFAQPRPGADMSPQMQSVPSVPSLPSLEQHAQRQLRAQFYEQQQQQQQALPVASRRERHANMPVQELQREGFVAASSSMPPPSSVNRLSATPLPSIGGHHQPLAALTASPGAPAQRVTRTHIL